MISGSAIGDVLFSKTQQRVLQTLYGKPEQSFYLNEIVRMVEMGRGTVVRELEKLSSVGLITMEKKGNQKHYQANFKNPIYLELKSIVDKTFGIVGIIRESLGSILTDIEFSFIYGSIAKGEEHVGSDIDLMLVGKDLSYTHVMNVLRGAEESLNRKINPTLYSPTEFKKKLNKNAFVSRVSEQNKLWLKGQSVFENDYLMK